MPTFEKIEWMPPTITLINELARMGHSVKYITIYPDEYYKNFNQNNVKNISLFHKNIELLKFGKNKRLICGVLARIDILIKKIISHKLKYVIARHMSVEDVLWVVNELTVMYAGSSFLKKYKDRYIFTIYELHTNSIESRHIRKASQNALINVVPEYNRAHLQKYYFDLSDLPLVLPNKPTGHPLQRHLEIEDENIRNEILKIVNAGKKIIIYMGKITKERPLESLIKAVQLMNDKFELVVLGGRTAYLKELEDCYPNAFRYLGFVQPPNHLKVASWADIGVIVYVSENNINGLNALYCAPNKVYEYTGFGMPILANDIPGLFYTVEHDKCGYCVDLNDVEDITKKLENCINNYEILSQNAMNFFNNIDVGTIVEKILKCYAEKRGNNLIK